MCKDFGRLSERFNALIDEVRAHRMAEDLDNIEFAMRASMPASPSSLQAIGSHPDERLGNKVFVAMLRQTLGLSVLPSSNNSTGRTASDGDCLVCGDSLDCHG